MGISETNNKKFNSIFKVLCIILAVGSALAAIKCIFVGLQMDEEYAMTLSYRLMHGDRLLTEVWDPHQTSAFLLSIIEWVWTTVTGTTTFLMVWCRIVTTFLHFLVCFYLYKTLAIHLSKMDSFLISMVIFGILPKEFIIPEFSLMTFWFLLLIAIVLYRMKFYKKDKMTFRSFLMAASLGLYCVCLVLSYPSCAIVVAFILIYLVVRRKDYTPFSLITYLATMLVITIGYFAYLLSYMSVGEIKDNIHFALDNCASHNQTVFYRFEVAGKDLIILLAMIIACFLVSLLIFGVIYLIKRSSMGKADKSEILIYVSAISVVVSCLVKIFLNISHVFKIRYGYDNAYIFFIFIFAIIIAFTKKIKLGKVQSVFIVISSFLAYVSVMLLTNMNSFRTVKYLSPVIALSLIVIVVASDRENRLYKLLRVIFLIIAFTVIFHKGMYYPANADDSLNITDIRYVIHTSAAKGIFTEYMVGYIYDSTYEDWQEYVEDGDNVFMWNNNTMPYLNKKDVGISSYTTICTPSYYLSSLNEYYEINPDKYPDVIIVPCWFGELQVDPNDSLYIWIDQEYGAKDVYISDYFKYYIKRD